MKRWTLLAPAPVAGLLVLSWTFACGSSSETDTDTGADGSPPPSVSDAAADVDGADVPTADAEPPKAVAVQCELAPCYVAVSGNGGHHVCGLLEDRSVRCWGRDTWEGVDGFGALGRGGRVTTLEGATPAPVVHLSSVSQISVGPNRGTCARIADGSVHCWGRNDSGQLGPPPSEAGLSEPARVEGLPPVDDVRLGFATACAIGSSDRALYCWGRDPKGVYTPPRIVAAFRPPVKELAIGTKDEEDAIVVLLDKDTLASIGQNLPNGESHVSVDPVTRSGVLRIAPFAYAASDGRFRRWLPEEEVLYIPSTAPVIDVKISGATPPVAQPSPWAAVQGGVLTSTGRLFRWGPNAAGALGRDPTTTPVALYPVEMTRLGGRVISFATTVGATCASLVNGKVECSGANTFGELGRGSIDLDSHPEAEVIR